MRDESCTEAGDGTLSPDGCCTLNNILRVLNSDALRDPSGAWTSDDINLSNSLRLVLMK